jgi:choice-of-anchor B domain-containing protein
MYRSAAALLVFSAFLLPVTGNSQESGNIRFLANFIPPSGGGYTAGCWGWTDTTTGREYAILGNQCGTAIVEITQTAAITERSFIPGPCSEWREIQVHGHYAYVVSEAGGGTQIIDLSTLPDSAHLVKSFVFSSGSKSTIRAHTNHIRDGFLYLNGCATWSPGGILIFDLSDPENPAFQGEFAGTYIHDSFVRNDTIYGAGIYGEGIQIIDAVSKTSPSLIRTINYAGSGTHNTATTTDGRYVLSTDEIGSTAKTLKIWDLVTDLRVAEYTGSPTAIVHNVFVKDTLAIMSYYTAGIRVVDISDPLSPVELGGYDTRPGQENAAYTGAWSVYPFFPSGKIIIGDMGNGMFVVDMNTAAPRPPSGFNAYSDYATPTSTLLTWTDPVTTVAGGPLTLSEIRLYRNGTFFASVPPGTGSFTDTGLTLHAGYRYAIAAIGNGDTSSPVSKSVFAGGAAASAIPGGFGLSDMADGVRLTWTNPTAQTDGTPLNDLAAIEIFRDGVQLAAIPVSPADTGQPGAYIDSVTGYHYYKIRARDNEVPPNVSGFTVQIQGYGGLLDSYAEDFENAIDNLLVEGTWDTTGAISHTGTSSYTDSPSGNYPNNDGSSFITPRIVVHAGDTLSFWHIVITQTGDFGWVDIKNGPTGFWNVLKGYTSAMHAEWQDGSADPGDWFMERISLAPYAGDTVSFRFRMQSNASGTADGWYLDDISTGTLTGVGEGPAGVPGRFTLYQNSPNPFNPTTLIRFDVPARSTVRLSVFNMLGQEIRRLFDGETGPGSRSVEWDGRTTSGIEAPSGAYFYSITFEGADGSTASDHKRMLFIK